MKLIHIAILMLLVFLMGCQKKEVQLPMIRIPGTTEIQNHSSIWIFFKEQDGDTTAILNKGNKILNTHWIFNVDKRLPMKKAVPHLIEMQENRNKDSMHKKEGMLNYFSYADTALEQISLTLFSPVNYVEKRPDPEGSELQDPCLTEIEILGDSLKIKDRTVELTKLYSVLSEQACDSTKTPSVRLTYSENLAFQYYLQARVYLSNREISCDSTEYIYTVK